MGHAPSGVGAANGFIPLVGILCGAGAVVFNEELESVAVEANEWLADHEII